MKSKEQRYIVINETDGVPASPCTMTRTEAVAFMKSFPRRFGQQGYYLTSGGERIDPLAVRLSLVEVETERERSLT